MDGVVRRVGHMPELCYGREQLSVVSAAVENRSRSLQFYQVRVRCNIYFNYRCQQMSWPASVCVFCFRQICFLILTSIESIWFRLDQRRCRHLLLHCLVIVILVTYISSFVIRCLPKVTPTILSSNQQMH
jgi:hypothetical protein